MDELPPLFGPGQRLGRYELLQRLAVGGMAEVYLASSAGPGDFRKVVAIKRLLPQHALDPQLLRMFLDEARLMARLSHPNIPQVTDVDDGGGGEVPFFVMEYVHGTDLRAVLNAATGPLPFEQALAITAAVAAGLHHAHEHRGNGGQPLEIVHRDISPSNVLISFDGAVKVTDFGVAKWTEQKSFTHQGQLKGKFAHMSPEQCRGEPLDRRSDVFALGTLLYEMTTGHPPFVAESEYELLTQIISRDAAPPRRGGEIYPAALTDIVMRSLRRDRAERYPSTQALQLDLEAFAREQRWVVSPVALARYLESLFGAQVNEWREALASGKTLADHLSTPPRPVRAAATSTDVFAGAPATPPAPGVPVAARNRSAVRRGAFVAAMTVGGLALLLVATELTSKWQRALPSSPLPAAAILPASAPPTLLDAPPPQQPPAPAAVAADLLEAGPPTPKLAAASAPRRGREATAAARTTRRESRSSGGPPRLSAETLRAAARPTFELPDAPAEKAPPPPVIDADRPVPVLPARTPAPAAGARTDSVTPAASVRVWDPDSPVPP